jgi:hypothetical protein
MDIEHILGEFEKKRQTKLLFQLYDSLIASPIQGVRIATANTLKYLPALDEAKYLELFDKCMRDNFAVGRRGVWSLVGLTEIDPEKFIELSDWIQNPPDGPEVDFLYATVIPEMTMIHQGFEAIRNDPLDTLLLFHKEYIISEVMESKLDSLALLDPEKFNTLFENYSAKLDDGSDESFIWKFYSVISKRDPKRTIRIINGLKKGLDMSRNYIDDYTGEYNLVKRIAVNMVYLSEIDPAKFTSYCHQWSKEEYEADGALRVRKDTLGNRIAYESIQGWANIEPDKLYTILKTVLGDRGRYEGFDLTHLISTSLAALCKTQPEKYMELYDLGLRSDKSEVREKTAESLHALWEHDPYLYLKKFNEAVDGLQSGKGEWNTLLTIGVVAQSLSQKLAEGRLEMKDPACREFIETYLNSKYSKDPKGEIPF